MSTNSIITFNYVLLYTEDITLLIWVINFFISPQGPLFMDGPAVIDVFIIRNKGLLGLYLNL